MARYLRHFACIARLPGVIASRFLREIPAQSGIMDYSYVDTALWPGQMYQYRVEAVNDRAASATIAANGAEVLPAQLGHCLKQSADWHQPEPTVLREVATLSKPARWKTV